MEAQTHRSVGGYPIGALDLLAILATALVIAGVVICLAAGFFSSEDNSTTGGASSAQTSGAHGGHKR